jgi:hypothetical protein
MLEQIYETREVLKEGKENFGDDVALALAHEGILNWWNAHAKLNNRAFITWIVKFVSLVKPHAANSERSNSLHKLVIGDRRAVVENERARKLVQIYQNERALEQA